MATEEQEIQVVGTKRFDVGGFVSRISEKGLARTNRFRVIFTTPIIGGNVDDFRQISLNCESTEFPGRDLTTTDSRIYGPTFKTPYMTSYNDVSFTFLCDASLVEKRVFDDWISMINPKNSFDFEYRDSYVTNVIIEQLSDNEIPTYHCELIEAYPIQVNSMPVNWGDDNFHRVTVTMTYRYWTEGDFSIEEAEKDLQATRESANSIRVARDKQRRLRQSQEVVLNNRYRGIRETIFKRDVKIDTPEPGAGLDKPVQVDLQPPNFGITASAVRTNIGPR